MTMTNPWWTIVHYRSDGSDGEKVNEWTEQAARNVAKMARLAGHEVRLEHWVPTPTVLNDDRPRTKPAA